MFVQIWCQNFLAKIFFGRLKILEGVLLHLSKSGVRIFWPKFFLAGQKFHGGYFYICLNLVLEFFSWNFFLAGWKFWRGYFYICPNLVSEFLGQKNFSGWPKISEGVLLHFSRNDLWIFSQPWGYQNMKT